MPTIYYLSGAMRGKNNFNRELFSEVDSALVLWLRNQPKSGTESYDEVINPQDNFDGDTSRPASDYMNLDLQQVLMADVIVQLPGWQESEGAAREAQLALWAGKRFMAAVSMNEGEFWDFREINGPEFSTSVRGGVLDEAKQLITGDRNNAYGPPTQDFVRTASMASAFGFQVNGQPLQSHHVAIFMILLKTSRLAWSPAKRDSWVDTAGYAGCGMECAVTEE